MADKYVSKLFYLESVNGKMIVLALGKINGQGINFIDRYTKLNY